MSIIELLIASMSLLNICSSNWRLCILSIKFLITDVVIEICFYKKLKYSPSEASNMPAKDF